MHRPEHECSTPGCRSRNGHGGHPKLGRADQGKWCKPCAEVLASVRTEYEAEEDRRRKRAASTTNGLKPETWAPTCCNPYCVNEREQGRAFCGPCIAQGEVEEAAA